MDVCSVPVAHGRQVAVRAGAAVVALGRLAGADLLAALCLIKTITVTPTR
jgi:hypothetical protein